MKSKKRRSLNTIGKIKGMAKKLRHIILVSNIGTLSLLYRQFKIWRSSFQQNIEITRRLSLKKSSKYSELRKLTRSRYGAKNWLLRKISWTLSINIWKSIGWLSMFILGNHSSPPCHPMALVLSVHPITTEKSDSYLYWIMKSEHTIFARRTTGIWRKIWSELSRRSV